MSLPGPSSARQKKLIFFQPANLCLLLGLISGILFCIFIPYGAGFDEETHLVRIVDIANFNLIPNHSKRDQTASYRDFLTLSYQRRNYQSPAFDLFEPENFTKKIDLKDPLSIQTRSIYPPVIFFPQALIVKIFWRVFDMPLIPLVILQRIVGLVIYLLSAFLTIRILPFGKWVFAVLALAPMALFQASTLNADGFTNAVSFLFIGLTLKLATQEDQLIGPKPVALLAGLCVFIGLAKPDAFVILPLLLILPRRRFQSKTLWVALWVAAALAVLFTFGWTALTVPRSQFSEGGSQSLSRQLDLILANPGGFLLTYLKGIFLSAENYFRDWVGVYGYWVGEVPEPVYWFYPLALILALLTEPRSKFFRWKPRSLMIALFLFASGAIIFLYYYLHYIPDVSNSIGRQGRYFIPIAPLFFLGVAGWVALRDGFRKFLPAISITFLLIGIGFYSFGLYAAYYTECGYSIYAGRSCVLPVYKNLEKENAPQVMVNSQSAVTQRFTNDCGKLEAIQVMVKSVPANGIGVLRYSLLDQAGQVLQSDDFPVSQIPLGTYFGVPTPAESHLLNSNYTIKLEAPDIPAPGGIGIAIREIDTFYAGTLSVAGNPFGGHLIFHYICANPWTGQ